MYYFQLKKCVRNQFIFKENDISDYIFIVHKGEFLVSKSF